MSRLALYLLGAPRVELEDTPVQVRRRKAVALLAYLAVTGASHSREKLATMLWPESTHSRALGSLRVVLTTLTHAQYSRPPLPEGYGRRYQGQQT
jgi:DNA-binding SARP family transcriptional activator